MNISSMKHKPHILEESIEPRDVIKDILKIYKQDDAFYICDIGNIIKQHKTWVKHLPRVEPFYAMKCNDTPIILALLASFGTGFDCASKGEISKILNFGVKPSRIIFANPTKPASHISYAQSRNVEMMTFDGEAEVYKTKEYFPGAKLVLRICYDDEKADVCLGTKYGCDPVFEGPGLLNLAQTLKMDVIGIAFHVGSGCRNPVAFYNAIKASRKLFDYSENTLGHKMTLLDIGGGFPGDDNSSFEKIVCNINKALQEFFPDPSVRVISEPGSFFVTSAYTLACNVYATRTITEGSTKRYMYYINDGVYGSFNGKHKDGVDLKVTPKFLKKYLTTEYISTIWGPTLDSADFVLRNIKLPKINVGDWIIFENMGAYSVCAAGTFNAVPIPDVYWVIDKNNWELLQNDEKLQILL